jgi:polyketide cyclase/dehydrase/lipid transport protein
MTEVREYCESGAPAQQVWSLVADFGGFVEMLVASRNGKVETQGVGVGMTRTIAIDGEHLVERLDEIDEHRWRTRYSMLITGPFPVRNYQATIILNPCGETRCALDWLGSFIPDGASELDAADAVRAVYIEGIALMRQRFGT